MRAGETRSGGEGETRGQGDRETADRLDARGSGLAAARRAGRFFVRRVSNARDRARHFDESAAVMAAVASSGTTLTSRGSIGVSLIIPCISVTSPTGRPAMERMTEP